ncbi:MAG TPA: TIR domain-containing protein [Candidatus Aquilonibacter sp.]|jgi:hypothetical protein|nr:TIR domain-containing protein [Candidatus Aquilonibacter sp.]
MARDTKTVWRQIDARLEFYGADELRQFFAAAAKFLIRSDHWDEEHPRTAFDDDPVIRSFHNGFQQFSKKEMLGGGTTHLIEADLLQLLKRASGWDGKDLNRRLAKKKLTKLRHQMQRLFVRIISSEKRPLRGLKFYEHVIRTNYLSKGKDDRFSKLEKGRPKGQSTSLATSLDNLLEQRSRGGRSSERTASRTTQIGHLASPHVFLSYSSSDKAVAQQIASRIRENGNVWLFEWEVKVGDSLLARIEADLKAADYILVLLSKQSIASAWFRRELTAGLTRELDARAVTIVPVRLEDCEIPEHLVNRSGIDLRQDVASRTSQLTERLALLSDLDFSLFNQQQFEDLILDLLPALGFSNLRRPSEDQPAGFDAIATLRKIDSRGREENQTWLIESKFYHSGRADLRTISELARRAQLWPVPARVLIATNGQLTSPVREWLSEAPVPLRVIEGNELKELLLRETGVARRHFSRKDRP